MESIRPYSTLRKIRDGGHSITVYCSRCGHDAPAPIEALAEKIGWDTDILAPDMLRHLRCTSCRLKGSDGGGHRVSITISDAATESRYRYPKW